MSGFIINLAAVKQGRTRVEEEAEAKALDLPEAEWMGRVQGAFDIERSGDRVVLTGKVGAAARQECVRCLRTFDVPVEADLTVFVDRGSSRRLEEDLERDHIMKFHDGRQIDAREETREALLLELPITPYCREDCRGLCPRCGSDLNLGPCGCSAPP